MAIKYFNVKNGLTAGPITLDADTGNATATNLTVTGLSDLGNVSNVTITGGSSGYVLQTDGAGNLSFASPASTQSPAPMPTYIAPGSTITISANYQGIFGYPITIDGTMIVDGILVDVDDSSGGNTSPGGYNTQLQYNDAGSLAGIATVTYDGTKLSLGNVANVKINGGSNGQVLSTDGAGNLSWTTAGAGGNGVPGGTDTQVQFNDASSFGGNAGFTFNKTTGIFTAPYLAGNGNGLSNIQGANVSGAVAYASIANSVSGSNVSGAVAYATTANTVAGSNVSGQVNYAATANSVAGANVTGAVAYATTANSVAAANISGTVNLANYATTANSVAGANVTGAVTYATTANAVAGANVSGTVASATSAASANSVAGANVTGAVSYATTANSVAGANVSGQVANALVAGTVYTNAQPNITSVGTLTSLTVNGNISANNANITGNIVPTSNNTYSLGSATSYWKDAYIGPGSLYINGVKVLEESSNSIVISADLNQTVRVTSSGSGDVQLQTTGSGVIAVKGPLQIQAGDNITSSNGGPIGFTNPINVDSLSSLSANTNLTISANGTGSVQINDDVTITGNLSINGGGGNLSVTSLSVEDNIIDISAETTGTPVNNAGIRVIRGDDPAVQMRWNETSETWQVTNDGSTYLNIVGSNTTTGNANVGNIGASAGIFTTVDGSLTTAAQPNITSVGTLSSLTATGNIAGGNLTTTGTGNIGTLVVGSGGANINGYTKITGNIDVTGNFNVTGNLNYQNVSDLVVGDPLIYLAANNVGDTDDIGIVGNYNDGTYAHTGVARDHTDGTWKFFSGVVNEPTTTIDWANAQYPSVKTGNLFSANITGTGWANITGNLIAGNANLGNSVTANYFIGSGANLTSIAGANVSGAVSYATTANNVAGGNVSGQVSYAATANSVAGANVSGEVSYAATANSVAGANVSGAVAYATTANAVAGGNVSGAVNLANYATTANAVALANVSGIGNIASLNLDGNSSNILYGNGSFAAVPVSYGNSNVATFLASYGSNTITTTGNVSVGNIIGNGQALSGLAGSNVVGAVGLATYASTANAVAGANVSGAVSYATTANAVAGANVSGEVSYAATANSVAGANVSGQVGNALVAGTVTTAAQPNITSTGTLTSLTVAGNIAINTSGNPTMTVKTTGAGNNPSYVLTADTNSWAMIGVFSDTNDTVQWQYNNSTKLTLTNDGNVTAGNLTTAGTMTAATVTETSSLVLKENFRPIENPLEKVLQLLGQIYDRKDGSSKDEAGLVAEDVYKIIPNLVKTDINGNPESVFYSRLSVYLLESIKVLKDEIDDLKGKKSKSKK